MKNALIYSLKVWLTAATVTPILAYLIWAVFNSAFNNSQDIYFSRTPASFADMSDNASAFRVANMGLDIFQSTLYSIPYFLIIFIAALGLNRQFNSVIYKKALLSLISILLTITPFIFLDVVDEDAFHKLQSGILAFEATILIGIWFYNISPVVLRAIDELEPAVQSS